MSVILGSGAYRYEVVDNWAKLPPGREFNAEVKAVRLEFDLSAAPVTAAGSI